MSTAKGPKPIKPLDGFSGVSDADVIIRCTAVQTAMAGNANYPNPSVDLAVLKTNIDAFVTLVAQAADGSKMIIAEKNKQRATVVDMVRMLGRYVEVASKGDMSVFQTSGFQPASTTRTTAAPLSEKVRKITYGPNTGQVKIWLRTVKDALSYTLRYAPVVNGATPTIWTEQPIGLLNVPTLITGLTPATLYAFQARAAMKDNRYTDWSDSITFTVI
ncbi:MAG TPA: hypothetical protein VKY31_15140 [Terriglobia bacterium]|nr:hypothetical protein [Terriglobia bacterium]